MKLLECFLISAFFSTAFCYTSLFFDAFEDVAVHIDATNYEIYVTSCDVNDKLFKALVKALQLPVKVKKCIPDDDELSNEEVFRLLYEVQVENALSLLQMPVVPIPSNKSVDGFVLKFQKSTLIVVNDQGMVPRVIGKLLPQNEYPTNIQIIVACPDTTFDEIRKLPDSQILHKVYFLIEDDSSVKLLTFEWFTSDSCVGKQLVIINEYKKSVGWESNNFEVKKFFNFHGCHIGVGVAQDYPASGVGSYYDSAGNQIKGKYYYHGYYVKMIEDLARNLNYKFSFNPSLTRSFQDFGRYYYTNISVDFRAMSCGTERYLKYPAELEMTNAHAFVENYLLVPPGELYTDLEKFLLPFDLETWICIIVVFVVAIAAIYIVGYFGEGVKLEVFGTGVSYPIHNLFAHFFGIGQNVLPSNNFARITLMTYILFSLVIRTAYQGKQFEFLQQEMRKPEIKTIDELIEKNYSIFVSVEEFYLIEKLDIFERAHYVNKTFEDLYNHLAHVEIYDSSFKGAIQISSKYWGKVLKMSNGIIGPRLLKNFRFNVEAIGLCLPTGHKFFDLFKETTDRLMTAGIMQRWVEKEYALSDEKYKHLFFNEAKNLSMKDLEVGFVICLTCLAVSCLVFCGECIFDTLVQEIGCN